MSSIVRSIGALKRDFLTGEELGAFELERLLDRAADLKAGHDATREGGRLGAAVARRAQRRPDLRVALDPHADLLRRRRRTSWAATRWSCAATKCSSPAGSRSATPPSVLSRMVDAVVIRSGSHERVVELAADRRGAGGQRADARSTIPVRRSPTCSPCASASATSPASASPTSATATTSPARWPYLGELAGVEVVVAAPADYQLEEAHGVKLTGDPRAAADGADVLYTDVWVSMGDEGSEGPSAAAATWRRSDSTPTCSPPPRTPRSSCTDLPAHPGDEITADVLYGPQSAVWDQAENRLHAQKALLELLLAARRDGPERMYPRDPHRPADPADLRPDASRSPSSPPGRWSGSASGSSASRPTGATRWASRR